MGVPNMHKNKPKICSEVRIFSNTNHATMIEMALFTVDANITDVPDAI